MNELFDVRGYQINGNKVEVKWDDKEIKKFDKLSFASCVLANLFKKEGFVELELCKGRKIWVKKTTDTDKIEMKVRDYQSKQLQKTNKIYGFDDKAGELIRIKKEKNEKGDFVAVERAYKKTKRLGKGGYGEVYLLKPTGKKTDGSTPKNKVMKVAYLHLLNRVIHLGDSNPHLIANKSLQNEVERLDRFGGNTGIMKKHKFTTEIKTKYSNRIMIMSKYDMTLDKVFTKLTVQEKKEAITQLATGLKKIHKAGHEPGYLHQDIKLNNILVRAVKGKKREYVFSDFGKSCLQNQNQNLDVYDYLNKNENQKQTLENKELKDFAALCKTIITGRKASNGKFTRRQKEKAIQSGFSAALIEQIETMSNPSLNQGLDMMNNPSSYLSERLDSLLKNI